MAGDQKKLFPLGELCSLITDGKHGDCEDQKNSGFFFLSVKDVIGDKLVYDNARQITERDFLETHRRTNLEPGDVLFTNTGTIGRMAIAEDDPRTFRSTFQKSVAVLKPKRNLIDPYFLFYSLKFENDRLSSFAEGTTQKKLLLKDLRSFKILLPSLGEQREIVRGLRTLDEKIALNQKMNVTLEAMVQALFKSWFVDFDPVHAKAEGRDTGLPKEISDLFPSEFQNSKLGKIPKGWSTLSVYDLATYINGAAYKVFEPNEEGRGLPIIKIAELKSGVTDQTKFSDVEMPDKYRIRRGDILFSWSGNPDTSIDTFVWTLNDAWLNQHIFLVFPHSPEQRSFVLSVLNHLKPVFAEIARNKQTTGLGHVAVHDMKRLNIIKPTDDLIEVWQTICGPLFKKIFDSNIENLNLSKLRDSLLPKLISGEVRLS